MENNLKKNNLINSSNIRHWGCNYFNVNDDGKIIVTPNPDYKEVTVELSSICSKIKDSKYPVLLNFPQIIQHRLKSINQAFKNAKKEFSYNGEYFLVYPIKVNQHRRVIDALINSGETMGLEAGSKAELLAVLNYSIYTKTVIICNGYKDREYIRIALIGERLGHKVFLVIEKLSELAIVFEEAKKIGVLPRLGVRARLSSEGVGKWQSSGGEKSKFGLSASQILLLVEKLKENNLLDSLQLLHFHLGSQIANIRDIIKGVRESSRFYVELYNLGVKIKYFDVGGGLGIDYEGTRSKSEFSVNYGLNEYANNIVWGIVEACNNNNLPHPNIITESGRALTTHHSVLVTNVIGVERYNNQDEIEKPKYDDPKELQYLWENLQDLSKNETERSLREQFHDSQIYLNDIHLQYTLGTVDLWQRAHAEKIYLKICQLIKDNLDIYTRANRIIIEEIEERMADKLYLNFSLFKSMPDAWGIEQLFPVLPLTNLDKPISRRVVLLDITCDSDGMIDRYIENDDINKTMPISDYDVDNPPLFGFFLIGSYQEILGNMHNLFGDTVSIDVYINNEGKLEFDGLENGNTVSQMLEYVNLDPREFILNYKKQIDNTKLSDDLKVQFLNDFKLGLNGYTYLED